MIDQVKMVRYGDFHIHRFGEGALQGYSALQLIHTSNGAGHFAPETKSAYIDLFSCRKYDKQIVVDLVQKYFEPTAIETIFLNRHA